MAFSYGWRGPNIVKDGLVLYLDAGSPNSFYPLTAGTTWKDISGNSNNGTLTNGPIYSTLGSGSISFDGADDRVDLGNPSSLAISTQITLESWIYGTSWTSGLVFPSISRWVGNSYKLAVIGNSIPSDRGKLFIDISGTGTGDNYTVSTTVLNLNTWYHTVGIYTGTSLILYVNGVNVTGVFTGVMPSSLFTGSSNVYVGADFNGGGANYFIGNISSARIYNRALTQSEILQNYNATKTRFGL